MSIQSVCVFCGASPGGSAAYRSAATALGTLFGENSVQLVYGGGGSGLMGIIADSVLESGGKVIGVIPDYLKERELGHQRLTRLEVVSSMHDRKRRMFDLADGIVVLPGGVGTLEEALEVITWKQLGMHNKPIIILNVQQYWQKLDELIAATIEHGFAAPPTRDLYELVGSTSEVLPTLERMQQNPINTDLARL
ncbi:MAG: TIGR00730 family Rossman fold protein [Alphaproteobacteria bacterium]